MNSLLNTEPSEAWLFDNSKPIRALLKRTGIQDLLEVNGVTEVTMNRPRELWFEREAVWNRVAAPDLNFELASMLARALAVQVSDKSSQLEHYPICPVLLPDGERGQIVMPPATERGCVSLTIRKPTHIRFSLEDYRDSGRLKDVKVVHKKTDIEDWQKEMVQCVKRGDYYNFFKLAVFHKQNMIFGGQTGSGKTTFAKAIVDLYPPDRRYITIEDVHELFMPNHPNRVHLFFNNSKDKDGNPILPSKDLVQSCMRMKGDHIFMSELRGEETWDYFALLKTGHDGSITTAHFGDVDYCVPRLTQLVKESRTGASLDQKFVHHEIASSLDIITKWEGSYLKQIRYEPEEKLELLQCA